MARKRMIDPEFWTDEALGQCTAIERLLFMGLISQADDDGRLRGTPALIRSQVFPYDDDLSGSDIDAMLDRLASGRLIVRYQAGGQSYIWLRSFDKHQTINKPTPSRLPPPPSLECASLPEDSGSTTVEVPPKLKEVKRIESKGREENSLAPDAEAPPRDEVRPVPKPAPERDPVWDALSQQTGKPATKSERSDFGRTVSELKAADITLDEINAFPAWWYDTWPNAKLTHHCYRDHLGKFRTAPARPPPTVNSIRNPTIRSALTADLSDITAAEEAKRATRANLQRQNHRSGELLGDPRRFHSGE